MILTTKSEKQHYFDKLITDPNHYLFYIGADGNLMTKQPQCFLYISCLSEWSLVRKERQAGGDFR